MTYVDILKKARKIAAPLLGVCTPDQAATAALIESWVTEPEPTTTVEGEEPVPAEPVAVLQWDALHGLRPRNTAAEVVIGQLDKAAINGSVNPSVALKLASTFPAGTCLLVFNADRLFELQGLALVQLIAGLHGLREEYVEDRRQVYLLGPSLSLPSELVQDVIVVDETYPDDERIAGILDQLYQDADLVAEPEQVTQASRALRGLSASAVSQGAALNLSRESGLDVAGCWRSKAAGIEQVEGLSVRLDAVSFADIVGVEHLKFHIGKVLDSGRFSIVLFLDELEKMLKGTGTDTSGTSDAIHQYFLKWMSKGDHGGFLLVGPPGTGKSELALAGGGRINAPTYEGDFGSTKHENVGGTERRARAIFKTLDAAAGGGRVLVLAATNAVGTLSPELRRRFKLGTYYVDLPDAAQAAAIWAHYFEKFSLTGPIPAGVEGWTGAEIRAACENAAYYDLPLARAQEFIVPVCKSAAGKIEELRAEAHNVYLDANHGDRYDQARALEPRANGARTKRAIKA